MIQHERSLATGESLVARPLPRDKFFSTDDPKRLVEWHCYMYDVDVPVIKMSRSSKTFRGRYSPSRKQLSISQPYTGVILHELAHHINYMLNHKSGHGAEFAEILQDLIDTVI